MMILRITIHILIRIHFSLVMIRFWLVMNTEIWFISVHN